MSRTGKGSGRDWWRHLVAVLVIVFALLPIVFVVSAALNPQGTLSSTGLIPRNGLSLSNVGTLFGTTEFGHWYLNSIIVAASAAAISIFVSAIAAYAFSRFRFKGRRVGLMALLLIQMFPQFLAIVALFLMFSRVTELWPAFGFNTLTGLTLVYLGGALGVNTWLMKGFFDTVPKELDESAVVDGASHAQVFFRIILPLVRPILAVTAMLAFIGTINEYLIANVFLTQPEKKTLAIGLFGLINESNRDANFGIFAVGTLLTAIPTVAVFMALQRYIVGGLTAGAVKG